MKIELEVKAKYLMAVMTAINPNDVRYYLRGVCIEVEPDFGAFLVGTDGNRLAAHRLKTPATPVDAPVQNILAFEDLKRMKLKPRGVVRISLDQDMAVREKPATAELAYNGAKYPVYCVDGRFPDWRRVVPKCVSGEVACYNTAYLRDISKSLEYIHGIRADNLCLYHNGRNAAAVAETADPDFVYIIMAHKLTTKRTPEEYDAPRWATYG